MTKSITAGLGGLLMVLGVGCVRLPEADYTAFIDENPRSVLVVPVLNNSPEVGADEFFLATITVPVAERGFYIFPVHMTRELLADAGLSDPGLVHQADPMRLGQLFGADAILYVTINNWEAKYLLLTTTVTVSFDYVLKSGRTGAELWAKTATMNYTPKTASSGNAIADLVVAAAQAAATKAAPNYIPLARQANWAAISAKNVGPGDPGMLLGNPMLFGPHHPLYRSDWKTGEAEAAPVARPEEAASPETPAGPP